MKVLLNKWDSFSEKQRQNIKGTSFVGIGATIILAIMISMAPKQEDNLLKSSKTEQENTSKYQLPDNLSSVEDKWLLESRNEIDELQKENKRKKQEFDRVNKRLVNLTEKLDSIIENNETDELRNRIEELIDIQNNLSTSLKEKAEQEVNIVQENNWPKAHQNNTTINNV